MSARKQYRIGRGGLPGRQQIVISPFETLQILRGFEDPQGEAMPTNLAVANDRAQLNSKKAAGSLQLFSTCPSSLTTPDNYINRITEVARWSEAAGCTGILVYTDNSLVDPWLVSQIIVQNTCSLCPLVAVQPVYMHPYSVAKMVSTLGFLYERRVFLNMVAGGFKNDLAALNDTTPHDRRYQRLVEYTRIIQLLLDGSSPVTFEGQYYRVKNLTLSPRLIPELRPGILMSGSSEAGMEAARETGATAVQYAEPPRRNNSGSSVESGPRGVRIGVVTRPQEDEAWDVALARFPEDRKGQFTRQLATKVSDSVWHRRLSEINAESNGVRDTYWLHPFENYQTNCPYLVGSYENVAEELAGYVDLGYRTFILDIPAAEEEFCHIGAVFQAASRRAGL
jgi:alkanesulfonate monooxygenase